MKTLSITVDGTIAGRADKIIRQLTGASHSQVRGMFDYQCVTVDGTPCTDASAQVAQGNVVSIRYNPEQRYRQKKVVRQWDDRTFELVFEDDDLVVVNKAAGTLTVPTDKEESNTLLDRVSVYISHSKRNRQAALVHRLDRIVSGLLVFGKHESMGELLIEQFKTRKPDRTYAAIVAGIVDDDEGTYTSRVDGEIVATDYRVEQRLGDTTLVTVTLQTGMRNQLRAHFHRAGHPVLGDPRYGSKEATHVRWLRRRIALHAKTLGFLHPVSGEAVQFDSPLPTPMAKFVAGGRLRRRPNKA